MDRTDLARQLSNLITQISSVGKTEIAPSQPVTEASAQLQMRQALLSLLNQSQGGQVVAIGDRIENPASPVIPTQPKGELLVEVLLKGQRFLLRTGLDLKPGMDIRFSLQDGNIKLQSGPISPPAAQLNAAIQRQVAQTPNAAPPPLNTAPLQQAISGQQSAPITPAQLQQLSTLLQQLPSLNELMQPRSLEGLVSDNRAPLAQQLNQLLQKGVQPPSPQPMPAAGTSEGPASSPAQASAQAKPDLLASLLQLSGNRNLPLLVSALLQALPQASSATAAGPEAQPLAVQLPNLSYPFPQKSSPSENNKDIGALLKRMAHWFKATQEQQQLHQLLQLQSSNPGDEVASRSAPQLWLEIPFRVDQQLHWVQLHLQRDQGDKHGKDDAEPDNQEQVWQLQIRLERPETGAIFASVYFRKPKLDIQFWAEQPDTLNSLRAALPQFTDILKSEGVEECSVAANPGAMTTTDTALDQRRLHLEA